MAHPVRRFLGPLPALLAMSVYLVLSSAATAPVETTVDTGLESSQHGSP